MEKFNTPAQYNSILLISELNSIGFYEININKNNTIVKDAGAGDRTAIQVVLDAHDGNGLSPSDIAIDNLKTLDLSESLSNPEIEALLKDVVRALRGLGLLL